VVDNFLSRNGNDDDDSSSGKNNLMHQLQTEANLLYGSSSGSNTTTQLDPTAQAALGFAGEFLTPLQGGDDQYQVAPRSIEWVVGVTKYLPTKLPDLDSANCMAVLRTYDASARAAARRLFFGERQGEEDGGTDRTDDDEPTCTDYAPEVPDESDLRHLSLRYYLVDKDWDGMAGALTFQSTPDTTIEARADRLVLYQSKGVQIQKNAWFLGANNNDDKNGNCIELHLLQKKKEEEAA